MALINLRTQVGLISVEIDVMLESPNAVEESKPCEGMRADSARPYRHYVVRPRVLDRILFLHLGIPWMTQADVSRRLADWHSFVSG